MPLVGRRGGLRGYRPGSPPRLPANREDEPMATKKAKAARAKFTKQARAKGATKIGRRAKSTARQRKKR